MRRGLEAAAGAQLIAAPLNDAVESAVEEWLASLPPGDEGLEIARRKAAQCTTRFGDLNANSRALVLQGIAAVLEVRRKRRKKEKEEEKNHDVE